MYCIYYIDIVLSMYIYSSKLNLFTIENSNFCQMYHLPIHKQPMLPHLFRCLLYLSSTLYSFKHISLYILLGFYLNPSQNHFSH